jgi:small nuclear ribonucleoprotein (snRNP)-like protein
MKITAVTLIVSLLSLLAGTAFAQEADDWHKVADSVTLGSKVRVQTVNGHRISGTLMRVDSNEILVKRSSRYPEPAIKISFTDIVRLERQSNGGSHVAKAIAVGIASGAGAMLTLILFAMQLD